MAEGGDPKGWVKGLDDNEDDEELQRKRDLRESVRKVMQQQKALQTCDDQGPIVAMPQLSKKWSTLIDDTIVGAREAHVKRKKSSVNPESDEDGKKWARSVPEALGDEPLERAIPLRAFEQEERPPSDDLDRGIRSPPPDYRSPSPPPSSSSPPRSSSLTPPPPSYDDAVTQPKFSPEFGHMYEKKLRQPKRKDLYKDTEVPKNEVELMEMRPRRIPYKETAIDAGPTPLSYKSSADAVAEVDIVPRRASPEVFADTEIDDLPPGVEDKPRRLPPIQPATVTRDEGERDVESGTRKSETFECTSCGRLNPVVTRVGRFVLRQKEHSTKRLALLIGAIIGILGLIVFLGVFPNSFVYVEHHEIALLKNTYTGAVYRDVTYYPGCYVLGPGREFVKFPRSAVFVSMTESVFTRDKLEITITFHFQYFIRPSELGDLHRKFGTDYKEVIESVITSRVKNSAVYLSVDEFRFNRTYIENKFFDIVKSRLQGTCCPECCPRCTNATVCSVCDTSSMCDPIYHVDVRYFQLTTVSIASDVSERYLQSLLLKVNAESEYFKQNHTVTEKKTELQVQKIRNEANEMVKAGEAEAAATMVVAEGNKEANITTAYAAALFTMYIRLGITDMDHKLSLMMIRALEDVNVKGNLYRGYEYANQTLYSPIG